MAKKKITTVTTVTTITDVSAKEIYDGIIIDRSGSMFSIWTSTIDGANEYINKAQRTARETGGKSFLSLSWFDDRHIDQYVNTPIAEVGQLSKTQYPPDGMTALNDAAARMIQALKTKLGDRASSDDVDVTITIFTDGHENKSTEFPGRGNSALATIIKDVQDRLKWTITYVGAGNQREVEYAGQMLGINASNIAHYSANPIETTTTFRRMSDARDMKSKNFMSAASLKSNVGYFIQAPAPTPDPTKPTVDPTNKPAGNP